MYTSTPSFPSFAVPQFRISLCQWYLLLLIPVLCITLILGVLLQPIPLYRLVLDDFSVHPRPAFPESQIELFPHASLRILLTPAAPAPRETAVRAFVVQDGYARPWDVEPARSEEGAFLWQGPVEQLLGVRPGPLQLALYVGPRLLLPVRRNMAAAELPDSSGTQRFQLGLKLLPGPPLRDQ